MADQDHGPFAFLTGLLVGAAAGVAVALMSTPRSGEETIELVRERGIQLKMRAEELGNQTLQMASEQFNKTQESIYSFETEVLERSWDVEEQTQTELQKAIDRMDEEEIPLKTPMTDREPDGTS
ncbi:MAG: YtxH domain-containing protein [Chloroflexota bacterium]|nr:YtxH domain-containing protein [Chloroflexota bacterium]